jgi:hypothetical protein
VVRQKPPKKSRHHRDTCSKISRQNRRPCGSSGQGRTWNVTCSSPVSRETCCGSWPGRLAGKHCESCAQGMPPAKQGFLLGFSSPAQTHMKNHLLQFAQNPNQDLKNRPGSRHEPKPILPKQCPPICLLGRLGRVLRQAFTSSPGEALTGERPGELGAGSGDSDLLPFTGEPASLIAQPKDGDLEARAVSQSRNDRCQLLAKVQTAHISQ